MESINWNELWKTPRKIVEIITNNQKSLLYLEKIQKRLKDELKIEKKTEHGGYVYEESRKKKLLEELHEIDTELEKAIIPLNNKKDIVDAIDSRRTAIQKEINDAHNKIREILSKENATIDKGVMVVERFFSLMKEIYALYKKEFENVLFTEKFDYELAKAIKGGEVKSKNDYWVKRASEASEKMKENRHLQEKAISYLEEIEKMKPAVQETEKNIETETQGISAIMNKLLSFLKINRKTDKEKEMKEAMERT